MSRYKTWGVFLAAIAIAALFIFWSNERRDAVETISNRIDEIVNTPPDYIELTSESGSTVIVGRNIGETDAELLRRAVSVQSGETLASQVLCWTSTCPGIGTVRICVVCMEGETEADCQARLDALVATWCGMHPNCSGC